VAVSYEIRCAAMQFALEAGNGACPTGASCREVPVIDDQDSATQWVGIRGAGVFIAW
jgi:hypothetical protein